MHESAKARDRPSARRSPPPRRFTGSRWAPGARASWRAVVALLSVLVLAGTPAVGPAQSVESLRDVAYVDPPHPEQHLDFHWPGPAANATVLFIHGGGLWESGERRSSPEYHGVCEPFLASGIACATMDYRLAPTFRWPAMPEDVVAAIVEVRELVRDRDGDPGRLFLFGHSSGCHLAAVVAGNVRYLGAAGLEPGDLAGIVAMGCTLDRYDAALRGLTAEDPRARQGFSRDRSDVERYGTVEHWFAANPAHHVGPHVPPTLVVVAEAERFFPAILEQGARFVRRLLEADVPADLVIVPGTHRSSIEDLGVEGDPTFAAIRAFLDAPRAVGALLPDRPWSEARRIASAGFPGG